MCECNELCRGGCTNVIGTVWMEWMARGIYVPHAGWWVARACKDAFGRVDGLDGGAVKNTKVFGIEDSNVSGVSELANGK